MFDKQDRHINLLPKRGKNLVTENETETKTKDLTTLLMPR